MAASGRAARLLKAMDLLAKKTTFDYSSVLSKVKVRSASNGEFQGTFTVDKSMCNLGGSLHGGYIASVTDVLSFYTQLSNTDARVSWTTSMNVNLLTMHSRGIFVFGAKAFYKDTRRDAISALPLEMSWKIFSYLDDTSLQIAARTHKTWARIILTNKKLRNRLNKFELAMKLGSESLFNRENDFKMQTRRRRLRCVYKKIQTILN